MKKNHDKKNILINIMSSFQWKNYPNLRTLCVLVLSNTNAIGGEISCQNNFEATIYPKSYLYNKLTTFNGVVTITGNKATFDDIYRTEPSDIQSDFDTFYSVASNQIDLTTEIGRALHIRSTQEGYLYYGGIVNFEDFFSVTFDGNNNPDASFLIKVNEALNFSRRSFLNINYINGAKKENVFITAKMVSSNWLVKPENYSFGNVFVFNNGKSNEEAPYITFANFTLNGSLFLYGWSAFPEDNSVWTCGSLPSTLISDYYYLRNVNLFSKQLFLHSHNKNQWLVNVFSDYPSKFLFLEKGFLSVFFHIDRK